MNTRDTRTRQGRAAAAGLHLRSLTSTTVPRFARTRFPPSLTLPAHRACQEHLPELRPGGGVRRQVQPAWTTPTRKRKRPNTSTRSSRRAGWGALGRYARTRSAAGVLGLELLRPDVRVRHRGDQEGRVYVCDLTAEEVSRTAASLTTPGQESRIAIAASRKPGAVERMRRGEVPDGQTLRQDRHGPPKPEHATRSCIASCTPRTTIPATAGIYPMWRLALRWRIAEGITHSICTLEFENHRRCTTGSSNDQRGP